MKKITLCLCAVSVMFLFSCGEKITEITMSSAYNELLAGYNFSEMAKESIENEDGSITYSIVDSKIEAAKETAAQNLRTKVEEFVTVLKDLDTEVVADISFSDDGSALEATVTDGAGAQNGLIYLVVPTYPDIVALQFLSGIDPVGITFKITDAETNEYFENTMPF